MEFPDLGVQCHRSDCNALDFLPFRCDYCTNKFCEAHWKVDGHQCPRRDRIVDRRVPNCPVCQQIVSLGPHDDPDTAVDRHIRTGCGRRQGAQKPAKRPGGCVFRRCAEKPLVIDTCPRCTQRFCIKHLHADVHDCKGRGSPAPAKPAAGAGWAGVGDSLSIFAGKRTPTPKAASQTGATTPAAAAATKAKPKAARKDSVCICA
ncbi:hypothetical protein H4R21_002810 [Coemansia helicoidea]|uniref:Uncharacterized protein n=1 Tax=Coemansia helicoidea TaxID=1286919 RepID=A0ACC1L5W8_9FUNG|nr:hypothetical protein H4R21_002810 [Coemansia helicoidea]